MSDDIVFTAGPILTWISREVDLLQIGKLGKTDSTLVNIGNVYEVDSHVQFLQTLASLDILYLGNIIQCHIQVL